MEVEWIVSILSSSTWRKMMLNDLLLQMTAFLVLFLLGGQIENQLLSTGAFEVYLNGKSGISQVCSNLLLSPISSSLHLSLSSLYLLSLSLTFLSSFSGEPVWSKLKSGRLPSLSEMKGFIEEPQFNSFITEEPATT